MVIYPPTPPPRRFRGFNLVDLLIALGLLGVIAAFTINKVLVTQGEAKTKAILKANVSELTSQFINLINAGVIDEYNLTSEPWLKSLNAVKECNYSVDPDDPNNPCMPNAPCKPTTICQAWGRSGILHDGSSFAITASGSPGEWTYHLMIDANGSSPPNLIGKDRLINSFDNRGKTYFDDIHENGIMVKSTNVAFYESVFE